MRWTILFNVVIDASASESLKPQGGTVYGHPQMLPTKVPWWCCGRCYAPDGCLVMCQAMPAGTGCLSSVVGFQQRRSTVVPQATLSLHFVQGVWTLLIGMECIYLTVVGHFELNWFCLQFLFADWLPENLDQRSYYIRANLANLRDIHRLHTVGHFGIPCAAWSV